MRAFDYMHWGKTLKLGKLLMYLHELSYEVIGRCANVHSILIGKFKLPV